ncbi:phosphotransferase [Glaciihabitans sp. dw_435]|uniref:phosphotransferase n=1 Tax=Glaciihabitans sp. dw_435 TaxID=2720081 RepID=UPI001BD44CB4|nr:phosphotransferase [Glaciihabitans sp. dw_435]
MARSHLTLAALSTAAVPGIDIVAATIFGTRAHNDFDSALLTDRAGHHWIIRMPLNARAEAEQAADLVAIRALSAGVRTRLPFAVSTYAGQAPVQGTRVVVYEFVYGTKVALGSVGAELGSSIGRAIAAIHTLPTSFVTDAGLPHLTPIESLRACITIIDRAAATALVPAALLARWEAATEESSLWQYSPTVINGSLSAESFLTGDNEVKGVLGWQELRVGDPARDMFWLLGARGEGVAEAAFDAYNHERGGADRQVRQRAMLYAELEIAKWLLHGTDTKSTEIVDDAVDMLHRLLDSVQNDVMNPIGPQTMPTMAVDEVEQMLDRSERAI